MNVMQQTVQKVIDRYAFTQKEAESLMSDMIKHQFSEPLLAAVLTAFRFKEEELPELTGMAIALKKSAIKINPKVRGLVDIGGAGGSLFDTFDVSILSGLIAAASGVPVGLQLDDTLPLGQDTVSVLAQLGVNLLEPEQIKIGIEKTGFGILPVTKIYPEALDLFRVRSEIGIRTILELIYRCAHPANISGMVLGVYRDKMTTLAAGILRNLGVKTAYVVHGIEGLDVISVAGETRISELRQSTINTYNVQPEDFSMSSTSVSALVRGATTETAQITKLILSGREHSARVDMVLLNAAAAIAAGGKAASLAEGLAIAQKTLYSGQANDLFEAYRSFAGKKTNTKKPVVAKKTKAKASFITKTLKPVKITRAKKVLVKKGKR